MEKSSSKDGEMQGIMCTFEAHKDTASMSLKTDDGSALNIRCCVLAILSTADKTCSDYNLDLQDLLDEYNGESHIKELRERA